MSTEDQQEETKLQPEVQQPSPTTTPSPNTTNAVTKPKDPKRVAMGRQLGLKSKEYKLKKQDMMKSEKQVVNQEDESNSSSGNKNLIMGAGGVVLVLGLGYCVYTKFKSSLHLPALTPAIIEQRESFERETRRRETIPSPSKIITPFKIPKLTGVVNME